MALLGVLQQQDTGLFVYAGGLKQRVAIDLDWGNVC